MEPAGYMDIFPPALRRGKTHAMRAVVEEVALEGDAAAPQGGEKEQGVFDRHGDIVDCVPQKDRRGLRRDLVLEREERCVTATG